MEAAILSAETSTTLDRPTASNAKENYIISPDPLTNTEVYITNSSSSVTPTIFITVLSSLVFICKCLLL